MMGVESPETCSMAHKRQVINLWNCCILLVNLFELRFQVFFYSKAIWISCLEVTLIPSLLKYVIQPAIDPTSLAILPFVFSMNINLYYFRPPQFRVVEFLRVPNNSMAAARICGVEWRQYSLRQGLKLRKPGLKCSKTCTSRQVYS
jgi:hypothetical protein